jgi:hypothetical protein
MVWSVDRPQRTQLGIHTHALVQPPMLIDLAYTHGHATLVECRRCHAYPNRPADASAVVPPFLTSLNHSDIDRSRSIDEPLPAVMPQGNPALCVPPFLVQTTFAIATPSISPTRPKRAAINTAWSIRRF